MGKQDFAVLVVGGSGFIGSNLVDALVTQGFKVRVLDDLSTGDRANLNRAVEFIRGDIRDLEAIRPAFQGIDCVFHAAALPRVLLSVEQPLLTHMVNVVGTINILTAARDAGVRRLVYSGSSSVYGDQPTLPLREEMAPNPLSPYAAQKLAGEYYARLFHRLFGMETLTLRYFNVFGPRMASEGAYVTAVAVFLRLKKEGKPLTIQGDGEQTRDLVHVSDVVQANILAMNCPTADGRALNIGQGRRVSINYVARLIGGPTVNQPPRPGDVRDTLADYSRAKELLNWEPRITFEEGLEDLMRSAGLGRPHLAAQ